MKLTDRLRSYRRHERVYCVLFIGLGAMFGYSVLAYVLDGRQSVWLYTHFVLLVFSILLASSALHQWRKISRSLKSPYIYLAALAEEFGVSTDASTAGSAEETEGLRLQVSEEPWSRIAESEEEALARPSREEESQERAPVVQGQMDAGETA